MKKQKFTLPKFFWKGALFAACAAAFFSGAGEVKAGSLLSVTEESQILAIEDGSGKYLLKSDGFYTSKTIQLCKNANRLLVTLLVFLFSKHFIYNFNHPDSTPFFNSYLCNI